MTTTTISHETPVEVPQDDSVYFKLEVVVIPVSDVDRAKRFYNSLEWREDADFDLDEGFRVVQFTPPGSTSSIIFGRGVTAPDATPVEALVLAVYDIEAARRQLLAKGVDVSEVFHGRPFDRNGPRLAGRDPEDRSYYSMAAFSDPDGNEWILQEIKTRLPGR
jgi:catechol 2,3-dioxygenase-like lactoylglutathione lyase family enzyme